MHAAITFIETRSKAQALDWSLVLISQGIENMVMLREDGVWGLELSEEDLQLARESIAAYERENVIVWKRELPGAGLLFDVRAAVWFLTLALFYWLGGGLRTDVRAAGAMDRAAVGAGEWWRLVTAVTLHADIAHLAANFSIGILFLGLAMGCFGAGNALFLSLLAGAIGNLATFMVHADEPFRSLGASGMVMASLGLITSHSLAFARHEKGTLLLGRGLMAGCLLVVLLGFSPRSDVVAHVGGFVGGIILGTAAMCCRGLLFRPAINRVSMLLFIATLVLSWGLALR